MDWDDIGYFFIGTMLIILIILTIALPIIWYQKYEIDKKTEVEKYKIEMELQKELIPKDVLKEDR